ncbi:MAG TPA: sodium:solute symporter, partial [Flavobacteriales bacterium]|nr:sodium:solute symporter [Flavobacteriales bacterium]
DVLDHPALRMSPLDWVVMIGTLVLIAGYGTWRTRRKHSREDYLRGGNSDRWWAVGFSVVATQLSAVTFLSTPGQGYLDGMRFVQFYFGLPLAMIVVSAVFIPLYYKWNVYTAYEFIGKRFGRPMRLLTAILFLLLRGLSAGITIYAPMIVLDKVLGVGYAWSFALTGLVILYTTIGGAKAVGATQRQQMTVIFLGLVLTLLLVVHFLSDRMTFGESLHIAGTMGRLNIITTDLDLNDRFTIWSGLIGGFFLQLAYFGTDQSQVGRYLSGKSARDARLGMVFNGLVKIPIQFTVLLTGVLVFVFYLFHAPPVHWNAANLAAVHEQPAMVQLDQQHAADVTRINERSEALLTAVRTDDPQAIDAARDGLKQALAADTATRGEVKRLIAATVPGADARDDDRIFLSFVMKHFPIGVVGLFLAVIFSASMGATSAELNALATTTTVDVMQREWKPEDQVKATRWATLAYGVVAMLFASVASYFGNLIQAVNLVGSLFYGTILGIFLVAFFLKRVQGRAVLVAALIAEAAIIMLFLLQQARVIGEIGFLWYNLIAPAIVMGVAWTVQTLHPERAEA